MMANNYHLIAILLLFSMYESPGILTRPQSTRPLAKAKAKANVLLLLLHSAYTSHHTTILNPISVCKLFLDIVKSLPPGRVTPRREPTFVFRHGDSAGLGLGLGLAVQGQ